ncbi:hypothetical protein CR956_01550 [Candidatus Saccharibacteria bacterium]|nr:MAG: hypothetical protein CR956_01550 [Candidatus Saccharibacteria bacterium]
MWVLRKVCAPRVKSRRFFWLPTVAVFAATFALIGFSSPVFADDAKWDGPKLSYQGHEYKKEVPAPLPDSDPRGRAGEVAYTWIEKTSDGKQRAHTIFFNDAVYVQGKDSATLIVYDYKPPDTYQNPSTPEQIGISANLTGERLDNHEGPLGSCSVGGGLGWILCPISMNLSRFVDFVYAIIKDFLKVPGLATTNDQSGMYELWSVMRSIANVAFIIAFLVIIYSQITSFGISNYGIKSMLPRLIIAAVLVNISYLVCALMIDVFNVLGSSLQAILENVRLNISIDNVENLTWGNLAKWIMAGSVAGLASVGFYGSLAGSAEAFFWLILTGLVAVGFAVLIAFVILAARQALIVVMVIVSPLAFVAYILPNTEQYFNKWLKGFVSLLVFFPVFSMLFGGAELAGLAIIQRGIQFDQLHIMIMGLAVQAIPLFITPLIIQFSQGLLGRIAGMVNDKSRGPIDGLKNSLRDRKDYAVAKKRAKIAESFSRNPGASNWRSYTPSGWSTKAKMGKLN